MEKLWKEGDRSQGICEHCKRLVETEFKRRTYSLQKPPVDVPNVLVAVCTACHEVVAIPQQSSAQLNEARRA